MDKTKRHGDAAQLASSKKPQAEPVASADPHSSEVISRIVLNKYAFSKVIGKGGQMITTIRESCGAAVKGKDLSADLRMFTLSGTFQQVVSAFDKISELLHSNYSETRAGSGEVFFIELAVEHSKTGKVVGPRGTILAATRINSGVSNIRLDKEPQELQPGQQMRVLRVEGPLAAIRRAHVLILELFYTPPPPAPSPPVLSVDTASTSAPALAPAPPQNKLPTFGLPSPNNSTLARPSGGAPVSLNDLESRGIQPEVVRQLADIEAYMNDYGLGMSIFEKIPTAVSSQFVSSANWYTPSIEAAPPSPPSPVAPPADRLPAAPPVANTEDKNCISLKIPREYAGSVIGRGGLMLQDLRQKFDCKIKLESVNRSEPQATRKLTVWHDDAAVRNAVKERVYGIIAHEITDISTHHKTTNTGDDNKNSSTKSKIAQELGFL